MSDRKGMELAINTLVVLILCIIILGGGMALVYKVYNKAVEIPVTVGTVQEDKLFQILLGSNKRIAVLDNARHVARKDAATFPIAFQNQLEAETTSFVVGASPALLVAPPDSVCRLTPDAESCPVAQALPGPYVVERYNSQAFYVVVDVPRKAESGQYVFEVEVKNDNQLYARTKIEIIVE